jgi:Protein of unknown function (DUF4197)
MHTRFLIAAIATSLTFAEPSFGQGGLLDQGRNLLRQAPASVSGITAAEAESGLREALRIAARKTVSRVGAADGYLKDASIHVPLPGYLANAKRGLSGVGASGLLDDLETRMNRAAEAAAPQATDILSDVIAKMSVTDAKEIISGPQDAATQYFKRTSTDRLTQAFRPIVDRTLRDAGATRAFEAATKQIASSNSLGALGGALGGGSINPAAAFNLTDFVLEKALAGLFHYVAVEEAAIRTDPAARTTDILKKVFGG